jgi:hypothetical protein
MLRGLPSEWLMLFIAVMTRIFPCVSSLDYNLVTDSKWLVFFSFSIALNYRKYEKVTCHQEVCLLVSSISFSWTLYDVACSTRPGSPNRWPQVSRWCHVIIKSDLWAEWPMVVSLWPVPGLWRGWYRSQCPSLGHHHTQHNWDILWLCHLSILMNSYSCKTLTRVNSNT